ncbi:exo-beta-N-acetylmuramidase NamZ family protein [Eisenibacter elegans]|uniref:exo-beta-N-acetylmuramidase NamZ family protein n=1 Tax=Eisenibacter elegans TaxID=997 RepID=UPI0003F4BD8D|nr:DUF1343 domain-containing protein [Eisenibacter elegans]
MLFWLLGIQALEMPALNIAALQTTPDSVVAASMVEIGAARMDLYLPLLQGKRVGLVVNHTSLVNQTHLVDTLLSLQVEVKKIFVPEHGFRGDADAGESVSSTVDSRTGLPIVSLYGKTKKPSPAQLEDIDLMIFDIQDVGTRFYTYISTMHYVMEACAEQDKIVLVFDRPNPNGDYIDGPICEPAFRSFVGMHPIPIVHGLTVGELALMINGENWLKTEKTCELYVVPVKHYARWQPYTLPVKPSPNLPNQHAIRWYPSLCLFEGTVMSVGRGTYFPFQVLGYPMAGMGSFEFVPQSIQGMAKQPKHQDKRCYGVDLRYIQPEKALDLDYLISFYKKYPEPSRFFNNYFDTLAGTAKLRQQIQAGMSAKAIRESWQKPLAEYQQVRQKYLLYQ